MYREYRVWELTWHVSTVAIRIIATEESVRSVAVDQDIVASKSLYRGSVAKPLAVDSTVVTPASDVGFCVLRELHSLIQALLELVPLRSVAAVVDVPFSHGAGIPWLLKGNSEGLSLTFLDGSWHSCDCDSREEKGSKREHD